MKKEIRFTSLFASLLVLLLAFGCADEITTEIVSGPHMEGDYDGRIVGTVHGIVTDNITNEPMSGVRILYVILNSTRETYTNQNGYYICENLVQGVYSFTYLPPDTAYAQWEQIINIQMDTTYWEPTTVDYQLVYSSDIAMVRKDADINGTVFALYDQNTTVAAEGVELILTGLGGILDADFSTVSDADGNYSFTGVPAVAVVNVMAMPWNDGTIDFGANMIAVPLISGASVTANNLIINPDPGDVIVLINNFAKDDFPIDEALQLTFSRQIIEESIEADFHRSPMGPPVLMTQSLSEDGMTLTLTPDVLLLAGAEYQLQVMGRTVDYDDFMFNYNFNTIPGIELESTNLQEADGIVRMNVGLNESLYLTFTLPVDVNNFLNEVCVSRNGADDVLVNVVYSDDNTTLTFTPMGSYQPNTLYSLNGMVYSTMPGDFMVLDYQFTTTPSGAEPGRVNGLAVDVTGGFTVDWNTRDIPLQWNAMNDVLYYEVYGYNSETVTDYVFLAEAGMTTPTGYEYATVTLPFEFDWVPGDQITTPFANGISTSIIVRAVNSAGAGQFSSTLQITDNTPPQFSLYQQFSANNTFGEEPAEVYCGFNDNIEYCNSSQPAWGFVEAGGDPAYVLNPGDATWDWNTDYRNGVLTITVPATTDASGDQLWIYNVRDTSGNTQADTTWITLF